jgi:anhydro-N-acetylmuramic acid kinase
MYAHDARELFVCGGGARNQALMTDLRGLLGYAVEPTDKLGIGTQDVEALAFAWLAWAHQQRIAVSRPAVTGARGNRILGACWPA